MYYHYPHFTYEKTEARKWSKATQSQDPNLCTLALESNLVTTTPHWLNGGYASPREARVLCASISKHFWVSVRCSYNMWLLGRLKRENNWTQAYKYRIHESWTLTIAVFVRLFLKYLWGFVKAPAVLVTMETRQQNIFISIHLAKPQCLLCVITDHKMAEDQLLYLRAFVLKKKKKKNRKANMNQINCKMFGSCLPSGDC